MTARELLPLLVRPLVQGPLDAEIASVTADSRLAGPAGLFVAIRGNERDGNEFVEAALQAGAAGVVSEFSPPRTFPAGKLWIQLEDPRLALSAIASALAGEPSVKLRLAGVTGTNGKTTTCFLLHHIMKAAWHRAGLMGTIQIDDGLETAESGRTTPDAVVIQGFLRRVADHGCRGAALEVSSHGICQQRVAHVAFDALVFTNLTQDHLDYHGTLEKYAEAKFSWFAATAGNARGKKPVAVINVDDATGAQFAKRLAGKMPVTSYGFGLGANVRTLDFKHRRGGTEIKLEAWGRQYLVRVPLIGRFNVYNVMAAIAASKGVGIGTRKAIAALADSPQVPGRMEHCGTRGEVSVYVDYAHTPDALEKVCRTLRELEPGRLITVFGCGGDRDRTKRPLMGQAAARGSDVCVVTSDNPRHEDPEAILREIEAGMRGGTYQSIVDRGEAIRLAIHAAHPGDIVLVAGKGHEAYQETAGERIYFDDRRVARQALMDLPGPKERRAP